MNPDLPLILHDYWRSSAAYRVRIVLHLKGLEFEQRSVHLVRNGGEQHSPAYRELNPQGLVPTLIHGEQVLSQSLAICEYLEAVFPHSPILPADEAERARVRAMAMLLACDVHPLNNLRVQQYLKSELDVSDEQSVAWMNHWMSEGFTALEQSLQTSNGSFCFGDQPGLADAFLIPQLYNARRFGCDLQPYERIRSVELHCQALDAFERAAPQNQPDAMPV